MVAGASRRYCESNNSLNTPLELKSPAGKYLSGVLQDDSARFHEAVAGQLEQLVSEREGAGARSRLFADTTEACLHRRIAELKEHDCQAAVEDIMYMLIFYKFSELRVHLVPSLFKCIYNGRLEILPSKDWELESIHSFEVLEMIKEHLTSVVGWKANSNVTENWATTKINRLHLCQVYTASIIFGYFLKSATLRYQLEMSYADESDGLVLNSGIHLPLSELCNSGVKSIAFGRVSSSVSTSVGKVPCIQQKKREKLTSYLTRFDRETLERCAKPRSKEALNLIEKHTCALFGHEKTGLLEGEEVISTSLASLKRFVLEAVAFGSFLWDSEEYVKTVYNLKEN